MRSNRLWDLTLGDNQWNQERICSHPSTSETTEMDGVAMTDTCHPESLSCSMAQTLTFKLQAAPSLSQELPVVECVSDHLVEGRSGDNEWGKKKNQIVLGNHV